MNQDNREPKGEVIQPIVDARWQVRAFAEDMERILKKNDHKGGWQTCSKRYLQDRLIEEVGEYFGLIAKGIDSRDIVNGKLEQKELIDIANFCMMLWDRS